MKMFPLKMNKSSITLCLMVVLLFLALHFVLDATDKISIANTIECGSDSFIEISDDTSNEYVSFEYVVFNYTQAKITSIPTLSFSEIFELSNQVWQPPRKLQTTG
jgi:hypothetical protein